jgi:hypothetical protein
MLVDGYGKLGEYEQITRGGHTHLYSASQEAHRRNARSKGPGRGRIVYAQRVGHYLVAGCALQETGYEMV